MRNKIIELIYSSIDDLNTQKDIKDQISKTENTIIFGKGGQLDSLGLVNLIVSLEEAVNDFFNIEITLADERAMSLKSNPFQTVSTLTDYILILIEENKNG